MGKSILYDQKLKFANTLGFKSITAAISKLTIQKFNKQFTSYIETQQNQIFRKEETNGVESIVLDNINSNYTLYSNGKVFSNYYGKVLKPYAIPSKTKGSAPHYTYNLSLGDGTYKCYQISRLVKFYFGNHKYKSIDDMPTLMYADGDTTNFSDENLVFDTNHTIILKASKKRTSDCNSKIKDTEKPKIETFLEQNYSYAKIAKLYNVSDMSVSRFVKRNNLR